MSLKKAGIIIFIVLLIDQVSKVYIKTHYQLHGGFSVFGQEWFRIYFIENEGMAWGAKIPGQYGKLFLTLFRLVAIVGIGYWLWDSVKKQTSRILTTAVSFIFAGAFGNIIDSVFYGMIFNDSLGQVATFMPEEGGYAPIFYGKVVDMLYFPLWSGDLPEWIPFWGGERFTFFEPVFNIADASITCGVLMLLVFHKKAFPKKPDTVASLSDD
ncbi:lipoprotein signal peptidase [Gilvibacter sp. SZ-19]|jgi:signal peptidase II|uniref:lipoprotein signal peptidase n=1 Tax=unclassified Gilvibacter TaxID=2625242 RepID=UPI000B3BDDB5|nr:lipoprotein signal peptidase [Gilvibacter sp. SZ-19]ARV12032.1 lipoprotein signal peptidase [Gilvibacter sp. SZ-19]